MPLESPWLIAVASSALILGAFLAYVVIGGRRLSRAQTARGAPRMARR